MSAVICDFMREYASIEKTGSRCIEGKFTEMASVQKHTRTLTSPARLWSMRTSQNPYAYGWVFKLTLTSLKKLATSSTSLLMLTAP
jgi:hypothetical protein